MLKYSIKAISYNEVQQQVKNATVKEEKVPYFVAVVPAILHISKFTESSLLWHM